MRKKLNNMTQLSEAIGISRPTLSRYFQDPDSVRKSTRDAIDAALLEFDYKPSFFARNLNRKTTRVLGIVIPTISDQFYSSLVEVIERRALSNGLTPIIQNSHGDITGERDALITLRSMNAAGVVIASIGGEEQIPVFEATDKEMPLVFVDSSPTLEEGRFSFVGTDNRQSVNLLIDYLCRTGSPPVFVSMPDVNTNTIERTRAYRDRMNELGHEPQIISNPEIDSSWLFEDYAYRLLQEEFSRGRLTDATILCANDRLAMGVLLAANEFGLFDSSGRRKGDFRVAGHDDHPLSSFLWPPLTTVSQDVEELGRVAFEMFLERSNATQSAALVRRTRLIGAEMVLRSSA